MNIRRDGQIWYTDFMVGILILTVMIVVYFQFINNFSFEHEGTLDDNIRDAKLISNSLMSRGYPLDWNSTNVSRIGIIDGNNRLNISRLQEFAVIDYTTSKGVFAVTSDYYVYFEKASELQVLGGVQGVGLNGTNSSKLASITRIVFYDGNIYEMKVFAWS